MQKLKSIIREFLKDDMAKFRLTIGLKFALIPIFSLLSFVFFNYLILRIVLITVNTFESSRKFIVEDLLVSSTVYSLNEAVPYLFGFFVFMFIVGMITANFCLRPFTIISNYCESYMNGDKVSFDPQFSAELKLLSGFSEWFFSTIDILGKSEVTSTVDVPPKYKRIHKPVFETNFFMHNSLIIVIVSIISASLIYQTNHAIYDGTVKILTDIFDNKMLNLFLNEMYDVFVLASNITITINILSYFVFLFYLYSRISSPAFGVFATMRSFISGRRSARVHLIGYPYIRKYTRILNKYLDQAEKQFSQKKVD